MLYAGRVNDSPIAHMALDVAIAIQGEPDDAEKVFTANLTKDITTKEMARANKLLKQKQQLIHIIDGQRDAIANDISSIASLEKADEKLDGCLAQLAGFEIAEDGQSTPKIIGDDVSHDSATEYRANLLERHLPGEYAKIEAQKNSVAYDCLKNATTFRRHSEKFAQNYPYWAKVGSVALQGIGYLGLTGIVKAGLKLGGKKMMAFFGSQLLSQEVIAAVIEHGTETLADHAIVCASNE